MKKVVLLSAMMLTAMVSLAKAAIEREQSQARLSYAEYEQARPKVKAAIEREQSQARLSYAEYEQARPKVKDIKTVVVTTLPQMHCESCENKIKGNLRFEKGVKEIQCDIEGQRVTITYDADKTNSEAIIKSFGKFGYQATEVKKEEQTEKKQAEKK